MQHRERRVWGVSEPMSPRWSLVIGGLAIFSLVLAATGFFLYDGWHRVAYVSAFALIGLGNLCLAVGSRLGDPQGRTVRALAVPISALMFIALAATMLFQFGVLK